MGKRMVVIQGSGYPGAITLLRLISHVWADIQLFFMYNVLFYTLITLFIGQGRASKDVRLETI